jgi:hypothetical protein
MVTRRQLMTAGPVRTPCNQSSDTAGRKCNPTRGYSGAACKFHHPKEAEGRRRFTNRMVGGGGCTGRIQLTHSLKPPGSNP